MNNCEQLQKLSGEHHNALEFAENIALIAAAGSEAELAEGVESVNRYYESELEDHLQHEEQTIFAPLIQQHPQHIQLCITLGKEHGFLRTVVEEMTLETARRDLAAFASVLENHSLMEERELFPLLESLFSKKQLDAVLNYVPLRKHPDREQIGL